MLQESSRPVTAHKLEMQNRNHVDLTGITEVVSFDNISMVKIEIGKVMNLKRITKNNQPTKFPFVVTSEAGFGAGTPQQEHFKTAGALQKCSPGWARNFQEWIICGHGTVLVLYVFLS